MRMPPQDATLFERVLFVVNDYDPAALLMRGASTSVYEPLAADLVELLLSDEAVSPDTVADVCRHRPHLAAWALEPEHRWTLSRMTQKLADLR